MRTYTAPEKLKISELEDAVSVFLSGGITGCRNWQEDVITALGSFPNTALYNLDSLVVFNPRREEFVDDDVNAIAQIKWEHVCLELCDIVSVFFPASESVQPITLYELGKYSRSGKSQIVTIQSGYKRELDVVTQMALDPGPSECTVYQNYEDAVFNHARRIAGVASYIGKSLRRGRLAND